MANQTPLPVDGFTKAKGYIAFAVQLVTQVLSGIALLGLGDPWNTRIVVAIQILGAIGTVVGVVAVPNKPIVAGAPVDGAYQITAVAPPT